jgi:hypothetical protein
MASAKAAREGISCANTRNSMKVGLSVGGIFSLSTEIIPIYETIDVTNTSNLLIFSPSFPVGIPNDAKLTNEMNISGRMTVMNVTVG